MYFRGFIFLCEFMLSAFNNDECVRTSLSYPCRFKRRGTILAAITGCARIVYVLKPAFRSVITIAKEAFSLCLIFHCPPYFCFAFRIRSTSALDHKRTLTPPTVDSLGALTFLPAIQRCKVMRLIPPAFAAWRVDNSFMMHTYITDIHPCQAKSCWPAYCPFLSLLNFGDCVL